MAERMMASIFISFRARQKPICLFHSSGICLLLLGTRCDQYVHVICRQSRFAT